MPRAGSSGGSPGTGAGVGSSACWWAGSPGAGAAVGSAARGWAPEGTAAQGMAPAAGVTAGAPPARLALRDRGLSVALAPPWCHRTRTGRRRMGRMGRPRVVWAQGRRPCRDSGAGLHWLRLDGTCAPAVVGHGPTCGAHPRATSGVLPARWRAAAGCRSSWSDSLMGSSISSRSLLERRLLGSS